ncbi:MAG: hypothetical protein PVF33_10905, partial [Candidatus Latescibacterota bacterium]
MFRQNKRHIIDANQAIGCHGPKSKVNITNALTIDVEDYFQVSAFENSVARASWDQMEHRVERNMETILAMLSSKGVKATFFTLGWLAERYP